MKIRFLKNIIVEVEKPRIDEIWDKNFNRWDELIVETINYNSGKKATIYTDSGDILIDVPDDAFETIHKDEQ